MKRRCVLKSWLTNVALPPHAALTPVALRGCHCRQRNEIATANAVATFRRQ
jgi:hypothetical protein